MTGLEVVVAHLVTRAMQRARSAGGRVNTAVDRAVDADLDRLHGAVTVKLGEDPALEQLHREAVEGVDNPRTRKRVLLSLEEAVEQDREFARALRELTGQLARLSGVPQASLVQTANASDHSTIMQAGRDISVDRSP
ncbi:hypothetical protein [Streptomyces sp. NPDC047065]|uniref:hypothetical protein n=1 Tax=Streptomyces sp. NPDC047065 TaxID=3154606 RepID=UPI0033D67D4E